MKQSRCVVNLELEYDIPFRIVKYRKIFAFPKFNTIRACPTIYYNRTLAIGHSSTQHIFSNAQLEIIEQIRMCLIIMLLII